MRLVIRLLNRIGLFTERQVKQAYENGRYEEGRKMYVIDTNQILLYPRPGTWEQMEFEKNLEEKFISYPFSLFKKEESEL